MSAAKSSFWKRKKYFFLSYRMSIFIIYQAIFMMLCIPVGVLDSSKNKFSLEHWQKKSFYGPALNTSSKSLEKVVFQPRKRLIARVPKKEFNTYLKLDGGNSFEIKFCENMLCDRNFYGITTSWTQKNKCIYMNKDGEISPLHCRLMTISFSSNQLYITTNYYHNQFSLQVTYEDKVMMARSLGDLDIKYIFLEGNKSFFYKTNSHDILYTNDVIKTEHPLDLLIQGDKQISFQMALCSACILKVEVMYMNCKDEFIFKGDLKQYNIANFYLWKTVGLNVSQAWGRRLVISFETITDTVGFWCISEDFVIRNIETEKTLITQPNEYTSHCLNEDDVTITTPGIGRVAVTTQKWRDHDVEINKVNSAETIDIETSSYVRGLEITLGLVGGILIFVLGHLFCCGCGTTSKSTCTSKGLQNQIIPLTLTEQRDSAEQQHNPN